MRWSIVNNNIEKLVAEILGNEEYCKKLYELSSLEEVYNYCLSIQDGYTIEEFEEFLENIDVDEPKIFEDEYLDLKNVSGGAFSNRYVKVMACSLAALTATYPAFQYTHAAGNQVTDTKLHESVKKSNKKGPSFWQKYKKHIVKSTMIGATILGMFLLYYKVKNVKIEDTPSETLDHQDHNEDDLSEEEQMLDEKDKGSNKEVKKSQNIYAEFKQRLKKAFLPNLAPFEAVGDVISDLSSLARKVTFISAAVWPARQLWNQFLDFRRYLDRKLDSRELPLEQSFENLDLLFAEVRGQSEAKKRIKSKVYDILHMKNQAKLTGQKYEHADVLYFAGPSGVGKTLMARGLAKYKILTANTEPFYVSASDVDRESSESVIEQLFGLNRYYGGSYGGYGSYDREERNVIVKPKNLVKYINENPGGIIIIDEYDKLRSNHKSYDGNKPCSNAMDEVLRTAMDNGRITIKGQTLDVSGMTFIITSNESKKSLEGGNQDFEKDSEADDGTGSRTIVKHDKSFINRVQPIEFENLSSAEYKQIIEKEIHQYLVDYWSNPEVKGLEVVIDDKCLEAMAKVVERKNQGARYITKLRSDLFLDISLKVFDGEVKEKDYYRGKKLFVHFDPESEKFTVSDN